jgi:conjugative relaxase-like TrwC/TraI family protein
VLSIGKLGPGQQQYYLDTVARGAEEYWTNAKEAPGQWVGQGSALLGVAGEIDGDDLHRVLEHRDPKSGTRLTRAQGAPKVAGFDATFCAPKSVSLLFALGDPETSNQVRNAHDVAVTEALSVLEAEAARGRRGKAGAQRVVADGFVAAAFRHRTSRAGDPHLHTHVLVANLVNAVADGRWSALDARPLYAWAKTVGYLYEAQLRAEMTRRLGVEWSPVRKGIADVKGIPKATLREFSRRREEIEAHMAERGETSARAAQVATYATRTPKDRGAAPEGLVPEWRARAEALGLDDAVLAGLVGRAGPPRSPVPGTDAAEALFATLASPEGLTAQASTFGRREVIQAICSALPHGGDIADVLTLTDAFLTSEHVVALSHTVELRACDVIRRLDGTVVPAHLDEGRFTTPEMIATEQRLVASALHRRHGGFGVERVDAALAARPALSAEQRAMVRRVTGSGAGVEVVEGAAGSGKTFGLAAAREAWEASGQWVVGAALAARAAAELETGSGIRSHTLDRLLADLDRPDSGGLPPRAVVVVDEAAMVGTRKLARLLTHAEAAGAKVVLVGDRHQLPEIDAGGAFAGLAKRLGFTALIDNRRQDEAWERNALAHLRAGRVNTALAAYQAHGRIHEGGSADEVRQQLVEDWWAARMAGGRQLMVATRRSDVDDLNRRARERLQAAGQLDIDQLLLGGRRFAVGDEVLTTRNDYGLGVLNGTRATVSALDFTTGDVAILPEDGRQVVLPFAYAESGHLTHGYATTLHKAQGATLRQAFLLADDTITHQRGYSGLSRGTAGNDVYVVGAPDEREDVRHVPEEQEHDPLEQLAVTLARSEAKTMSLDELLADWIFRQDRPPPNRSELLAERQRLRARIGPTPYPPFEELAAARTERQRAEARKTRAVHERRAAERELRAFGSVNRLLHPKERKDLEARLQRAANSEKGAEEILDRYWGNEQRLDDKVREWNDWQRKHRPDLDRLTRIDSMIRERGQQSDRSVDRRPQPTRAIERDIGLDLGL